MQRAGVISDLWIIHPKPVVLSSASYLETDLHPHPHYFRRDIFLSHARNESRQQHTVLQFVRLIGLVQALTSSGEFLLYSKGEIPAQYMDFLKSDTF